MSTQTYTPLNGAQSLIYTQTNLRRAFPDFEEGEVASIYLRNDHCIVARIDGSHETYERQLVVNAYLDFRSRLKDFFSYLGPNYRGPSPWRNEMYVMFKGWHHAHALGHLSRNAQLQTLLADKFTRIQHEEELLALIQSDQADIGHLVAPNGIRLQDRPISLDGELDDQPKSQPMRSEPYCSCGSFQSQFRHLSLFEKEIPGFKPDCIHLRWHRRWIQHLGQLTQVRNNARNGQPSNVVAWWYAPPSDGNSDGNFVLLHTKSGAQAPATHWRLYGRGKTFTQHDAWTLFNNMMEADYLPIPGKYLEQLKPFVKNNQLVSTNA